MGIIPCGYAHFFMKRIGLRIAKNGPFLVVLIPAMVPRGERNPLCQATQHPVCFRHRNG